MLIRELLFEFSEPNEIIDDLMDMITGYLSQGLTSIPMIGHAGMVTYLQKGGHQVNASDVMKLLSGPEFKDVVTRSTPDSIELKTDSPPEVGQSQLDKSKEKVTNDAEQQATKSVKAGSQI